MLKNALFVIIVLFFSLGGSFAASPLRILLFPLTESAPNSSISWLGEGTAQSISEQLSESGIGVISRDDRIDLLERNDLPPNAGLSRGSMIFIAQRSSADHVVMGSYQGTEQNLKLSVWLLNLKTLKLSNEMMASGPLAALPQMENELAWMILSNLGLDGNLSREKFRERTRRVSNLAYAYYIQSLNASSESDQIRLLEKALQSYSDFPNAHFLAGRLYYQNREYANAIPHLIQSSNNADTRIQSLFFLGNCYLQENKNTQALQTYSQVLSFSRRSEILNNRAVAHFRTGDLLSSIQDLLEATNLSRSDSTVAMNMAILRHLTGNDSAALTALEDSLKSHPENGMLHFLWGFLLNAKGEKDRAAQATNKARELGIPVDALQGENPKTWIRIIPGWTDSKVNSSTGSRQ